MSQDKIIIETREVKTLGCAHAIRTFFRGIIAVILTVSAMVFLFGILLTS